MKNLKKINRFLALALTFVMLISLWPTAAIADEATTTSDAVVYKHTNAPGQYTNEAIGLDKNSTLDASAGMVSLGAYGGNISWKFTNPIKNDTKNPYGVDFILYGNAFAGNEEPSGVEVAQDKNNDGIPDKWYEIANSEYFESSTLYNYSVTYQNPDTTFTQALDVPWTDSLGGSGTIDKNGFHNHAYYPNPANYDDVNVNSLALGGTKLATNKVAFGCADVHENGTIDDVAGNPYIAAPNKGDGIDISWAVDENNNPINLDEISFVKIYNNVQMSLGSLGEVGPEVSYITRAKSADAEVGKTDDVTSITVDDKKLSLTAGVHEYDVNSLSDSFDVNVETTADNVFVNNTRANTLNVAYGDKTERTVRVMAQTGEKAPVTYFLHIHKKVENQKTLTVRVEGSKQNILYNKSFTIKADSDADLTALDALKQALDSANIPYSADNGYVSSINNETAGSFGGYDGWFYQVNNVSPTVGMGAYNVQNNDDLVVYYGDMSLTAYPLVTTTQTRDTITLTCRYNGFDANWNAVNLPLPGATITLNGKSYITDENGAASIAVTDDMRGKSYVLGVEKAAANGLPQVVRLANDEQITVQTLKNEKTLTVRVEGAKQNILYNKSFTVQTDSDKEPTALDALEQALDSAKIPYAVDKGYVSSINNETVGRFGGYDGWFYQVNAVSPTDSMGAYQVQNNDDLVVYYGDMSSTAYPLVTTTQTRDTITLTCRYNGFDANWNAVNLPLSGATITLNGKSYITDENGVANIPVTDDMRGNKYVVGMEKAAANGLPQVVRFANDEQIVVAVLQSPTKENSEIAVTQTPMFVNIPSDVDGVLKLVTTATNDKKTSVLPKIDAQKADGKTSITMNVAENTTVTGSKEWDGLVKLPTVVTNPSISGVTISSAVKAGSDVDLTFDKPIRLLIPDANGKKIGYIGSNGTLHEITHTLTSDNSEALATNQDGKIAFGNDVAIWTKHFTTFVVYSVNSVNPGGNDSDPNITVSVEVIGDKTKGTILSETTTTVSKSATAWTAIEKALDAAGISYVNKTGGYISSIDGLSELDRGSNSGWQYYVNGSLAKIGANAYTLKNGDAISVQYTTDYTQNSNSGSSGSSGSSASSSSTAPGTSSASTIDISTVLKNIMAKDDLSQWEMFDLAQNGLTIGSKKLTKLETEYKENAGEYRLVTDYAKLAIVLKSMGKSATEFAGYPLLSQIYNNNDLGKQGSNGYIYSLIALSSETIPPNAKWTQEPIIDKLLTYQKTDGGFSLTTTGNSDIDVTAMALSALAPYRKQDTVKVAIEKALSYLKKAQGTDGNFEYNGEKSSETVSQVMIALSSLGMDAKSKDFTKNNKTLLDVLLTYQLSDKTFAHISGGESDSFATEQAVMALTAYNRYATGKSGIYELAVDSSSAATSTPTFSDIKQGDWYYAAVMFACQKGITSGVGGKQFAPNDAVTRGQFIKMLCDAYGIEPVSTGDNFADAGNTWYTPYLAAVKQKGISQGVGQNKFEPDKAITREEMFTLLYNTLKTLNKLPVGTGKELNTFGDSSEISVWANDAMAFLVQNGIVSGTDGKLYPKSGANRAQMAQIFYSLLVNQK